MAKGMPLQLTTLADWWNPIPPAVPSTITQIRMIAVARTPPAEMVKT